ncbi:MAG: calcium-binding protein [Actinomycetota bacterium]
MSITSSMRALAAGCLALATTVALIPAAEAATPRCLGRRATIVGTARGDVITGTRHADVIVARGGSDEILGRGGNDRICAGRGRDEAVGGGGNDNLSGGGGQDVLAGQGGGDRLLGRGGSDALFGGVGDDVLIVGPGFFQFMAPSGGNDEARGNANPDFVSYFDSNTAVNVNLASGLATGAGNDTLVNIDGAEGSFFNDTLAGSTGSNFLFGLDGNDTIESGGNAGDLSSPNVVLEERFDFVAGDAGDDTLTGGAGLNVVAHDLSPAAVDVDLQTGQATGDGTDTLSGIQAVIGTQFADTLRGDSGDNLFEPEGGADTIDGRAGSDTLGLIDAVSGNVDLGTSSATTIYRPFDPETDEPGSPITSTVSLAGIENVWGSEGNDVLRGDAAANRLFGFLGSDQIFGLAGDDYLDGGPEFDPAETNTIDGGDGTDTCLNGTSTNCEPNQISGARATTARAPRLAAWWTVQRALALRWFMN